MARNNNSVINRTAADWVNLDENGQYPPGVERYLTEGAIADLRERTNGPQVPRRLRMLVDGEEVTCLCQVDLAPVGRLRPAPGAMVSFPSELPG